MSKKLKKILIANRGEIALRIMRTLKEMDIASVAVYSPADEKSLHVSFADESYILGDSSIPQNSYLNIESLVKIAQQSGAEAIHPGYGFLSENSDFARAVEKAGLIFIGPDPDTIDKLGNKISAKQIAIQAGIPVIEGTSEPISDMTEAKKKAAAIGYPVLLKAAAGGGGRGMRVVNEEQEFEDSYQRASSEAQKAFSNGAVFIEKYVAEPRHIEVQILGDGKGNVRHFFERECSIQRRHQKVVEEAPASFLDANLRQSIIDAAVQVTSYIRYRNAGTVEFLVDKHNKFYFLEINTRLQVEHPVTEMITGMDLVREMIGIAQDQAFSYDQEQIVPLGHAIELRINGENPVNNFLPVTGVVCGLQTPAGPGIRFDSLLFDGFELSLFYDSLLGKLIAWDRDRDKAVAKIERALDEFLVNGVKTNIPFLKTLVRQQAYKSGRVTTKYLDENLADILAQLEKEPDPIVLALYAHLQKNYTPQLQNVFMPHWTKTSNIDGKISNK